MNILHEDSVHFDKEFINSLSSAYKHAKKVGITVSFRRMMINGLTDLYADDGIKDPAKTAAKRVDQYLNGLKASNRPHWIILYKAPRRFSEKLSNKEQKPIPLIKTGAEFGGFYDSEEEAREAIQQYKSGKIKDPDISPRGEFEVREVDPEKDTLLHLRRTELNHDERRAIRKIMGEFSIAIKQFIDLKRKAGIEDINISEPVVVGIVPGDEKDFSLAVTPDGMVINNKRIPMTPNEKIVAMHNIIKLANIDDSLANDMIRQISSSRILEISKMLQGIKYDGYNLMTRKEVMSVAMEMQVHKAAKMLEDHAAEYETYEVADDSDDKDEYEYDDEE